MTRNPTRSGSDRESDQQVEIVANKNGSLTLVGHEYMHTDTCLGVGWTLETTPRRLVCHNTELDFDLLDE